MPSTKLLGWIVFATGLGAYVPLIVGGWSNPSETNIACFGIWVVLSVTLCFCQRVQKYDGWRIQVAFAIGNIIVVFVALARGGYTFNIGAQETIALYGFAIIVCLWAAIGAATKKWNADILYLGTITVDFVSFYPILKQFLEPHQSASVWGITGWIMFGLAALINFAFVEQLFKRLFTNAEDYEKIFEEPKSNVKIWKASAFSLENFTLIVITVTLMIQ
ncbi:MAG TPA: hypothetical protein VF438_02395 [Candidatus Paceibacterota bacterium]